MKYAISPITTEVVDKGVKYPIKNLQNVGDHSNFEIDKKYVKVATDIYCLLDFEFGCAQIDGENWKIVEE